MEGMGRKNTIWKGTEGGEVREKGRKGYGKKGKKEKWEGTET